MMRRFAKPAVRNAANERRSPLLLFLWYTVLGNVG